MNTTTISLAIREAELDDKLFFANLDLDAAEQRGDQENESSLRLEVAAIEAEIVAIASSFAVAT